jgi:hypothetical protein
VPVPFACAPAEGTNKDGPRVDGGAVAELRADGAATAAEIFKAGIDDIARERGNDPRARRLTPQQRRARAEIARCSPRDRVIRPTWPLAGLFIGSGNSDRGLASRPTG